MLRTALIGVTRNAERVPVLIVEMDRASGRGGDEKECGKHHERSRQKIVLELGEADDWGVSLHRYSLDPLPILKCAKSSKEKT